MLFFNVFFLLLFQNLSRHNWNTDK